MEISQIYVTGILSLVLCVSILRTSAHNVVNSPCKKYVFDETQFLSRYQSIASSPPLLRYLAEKDEIIYAVVSEHYNETSVDNCYGDHVTRYMEHFETTTGALIHRFGEDHAVPYRPNNVAWNPLATFQLLSRFRTIIRPLVMTLDPYNEHQYELQKKILSIMWDLGWPTEEDLRTAASAIVRIQHVYDFNTTELATGKIGDVDSGVPLFAEDCNVIGRQALNDGYFALTVEWFEEAARKASGNSEEDKITRSIAENNIELSAALHDSQFAKSETWDPLFCSQKISVQPNSRERRRTREFRLWKGGIGANFNEINYWGVCSGENYQKEEQKAKLFCYYETKVHPAWTINPLKVEIVSMEPLLVLQYYDLIGDKMIRKLKGEVSGQLARSVVYEGNSLVTSTIRTSLNSWIDDNARDEYGNIPRTIELITGLRVKSHSASEKLQVASYAAGSHYRVHLDALGLNAMEESGVPMPTGDRLATFLFYLADVVKGGGTAFPQSGIASSPKKGSAVLWFNLKRSMDLDQYTWHGSCPVVIGEKWISNKWIHSHDQMFTPEYKCVADQEAKIEITVNGKPISEFY